MYKPFQSPTGNLGNFSKSPGNAPGFPLPREWQGIRYVRHSRRGGNPVTLHCNGSPGPIENLHASLSFRSGLIHQARGPGIQWIEPLRERRAKKGANGWVFHSIAVTVGVIVLCRDNSMENTVLHRYREGGLMPWNRWWKCALMVLLCERGTIYH